MANNARIDNMSSGWKRYESDVGSARQSKLHQDWVNASDR